MLFPSSLTFAPPVASPFEPRFGITKNFSNGSLLAEIGNTIEILQIAPLRQRQANPPKADTIGIAAEFFARTYVTGWEGLHLQVDAADGFFGGNIAWSRSIRQGTIAARLRFIHHSAHLLDGHWDAATGKWKDGRAPTAWTKDQFELLGSFQHGVWRAYIGISYATKVRPASLNPLSGSIGFEIFPITNPSHPIRPFLAFDLRIDGGAFLDQNTHKIQGTESWVGASSLLLGASVGPEGKQSIRLFLLLHTGQYPLSEYSDLRTPYIGAGFDFQYYSLFQAED
ncbi:MAG: hypothetical protein ACP5JH_05755 [Bacteroidota bacterium]